MIEKAIAFALVFPAAVLGVGPLAFLHVTAGAISIDPATTGAFLAALVGALGAYLAAARRFSGRIETTEAKDLWAESKAIREWSKERIETLNELVLRLERRNSELEIRVDHLETENESLKHKIDDKVDA